MLSRKSLRHEVAVDRFQELVHGCPPVVLAIGPSTYPSHRPGERGPRFQEKTVAPGLRPVGQFVIASPYFSTHLLHTENVLGFVFGH